MDMALLEALREDLLRTRLVRRRGRKLLATARGRKLAADPIALLYELALDLGDGDQFAAWVADRIVDELSESDSCTHDQLVAPAHAAAQWSGVTPAGTRRANEVSPGSSAMSYAVGRLTDSSRKPDPEKSKTWRALISLTSAGTLVLGTSRREVAGRIMFVFDAELLNVSGVSARVAIAGHERLTELHHAIQQAFKWEDDHLYSFWLDGKFWSREGEELVRPGTPDTDSRTADMPLGELRLEIGSRVAYVFDYGDDWRVILTLRERVDGGDAMPRVSDRRGTDAASIPASR